MQPEQRQYERSAESLRQALTNLLSQCSHLLPEQFDNQNDVANNDDWIMEEEEEKDQDHILTETAVNDDDEDDNGLTIDIVPLLPPQIEVTTAASVGAERTPFVFSIYAYAFPFAVSETTDPDLLGTHYRSSHQQCQQQHRSSAILVYNLALAYHLWGLHILTPLQTDDPTCLHHQHHSHDDVHFYQPQPTQQYYPDDSSNPLLLPFGKLNLRGSSTNKKDHSCFTTTSSSFGATRLHKALELYEIALNLLSSSSAVSSSSSSSVASDLDKMVALACFNNTGSIYEELLRQGRGGCHDSHHCEGRVQQRQEKEYATAKMLSCLEWIATLLETCEEEEEEDGCQSERTGMPGETGNDHQEGGIMGNSRTDCGENHDDRRLPLHHHVNISNNNQQSVQINNPLLQPFYAMVPAWQVVASSTPTTGNSHHHRHPINNIDSDTRRRSFGRGHIPGTRTSSTGGDHLNASAMRYNEFASAA